MHISSDDNDLKKSETDDEFDLYYGDNSNSSSDAEKEKKTGPLSRRPTLSSSYPAVFLSLLFIISTITISNTALPDKLWASRETVYVKHEYWRLFTSLFIHSDTIHLLSNIPFFIIFGLILYEYFGFIVFPIISLLTGAAANAFTLIFYPDTVRLLGASGMIYGMVSMWLVLYIFHDTEHSILMRIFRSVGFSLIVFFPETYNPSTSYLAHASGFVIGIISSLVLLRFIYVREIPDKKPDSAHFL